MLFVLVKSYRKKKKVLNWPNDLIYITTAHANLIAKTDFDAKLSDLNRNITANKSKNLLFKNELEELKTFNLSYIIGRTHFEEDSTQNYLAFQPLSKYFKVIANTDYVSSWNSLTSIVSY